MIYVVLTPGRTGSYLTAHMIAEYHRQHGIYYRVYHRAEYTSATKDENIIFHSHKKDFLSVLNLDPSWVTLVVSYREPIFDAIMSMILAHITGEYGNYSNKKIEPISLKLENFNQAVIFYLPWYDDIDLSLPYNDVIHIAYSDVLDHGQFLDKMKFPPCSPFTLENKPKSPYSYKDIIINWEYLKQQFDEYYHVYRTYDFNYMLKKFNITKYN